MAGTDRATELNKLLKNVYDSRKPENLENVADLTFMKIPVSAKKPMGNGVFGGVISQGNQAGQGSQNELEALRTPDRQHVEQYQVAPKVFTHTVRLSGLVMDVGTGNESSFADALTLQLDQGLIDSAKELNQQVFRDGSGTVALANGAGSATTTVTFDTGIGTHFRYGEPIDIVTAAGVKEVSGATITDVDLSANTITIDAAGTWSDNSKIGRAGIFDNAPTDGKELAGLPRVTDDGTDFASYENIIRSGTGFIPAWKGLEIDAGGANLSDDTLQRALSQQHILAGNTPKTLVSNRQQYRKYLSLTLPEVRYNSTEKRDSGVKDFNLVAWNGLNWTIDTDAGFDEVYLCDMNYLNRYEVHPLKFDTQAGGILKWDNGYDAFIAYAKYYGNIGSRDPRKALIRINNLAVPTF